MSARGFVALISLASVAILLYTSFASCRGAVPVTPPAAARTAPPPVVAPPPAPLRLPTVYTVRKMDSLWSIAERFYGDGRKYQRILEANPGFRGDLLQVGQKLVIPEAR